jgi:hypothetical protein
MKKSIHQYQQLNVSYLANLDSYDILNNNELMWLLASDVEEERIIASLLLRDRKLSSFQELIDMNRN